MLFLISSNFFLKQSMHTIFVGDKPIILTTKVEKETNFKNYLLATANIEKVIKDLDNSSIKAIHLIGKDDSKLLKKFLKLLPNVIAGGGKVYNTKGEVLFIYRNDKWDLPKGKLEKNESIENAALREVEEETGVKNLQLEKKISILVFINKTN